MSSNIIPNLPNIILTSFSFHLAKSKMTYQKKPLIILESDIVHELVRGHICHIICLVMNNKQQVAIHSSISAV